MTFKPDIRTSIHGKRLGLGTTGGLIVDHLGTAYQAVVRSTADVIQNSSALLFGTDGVNPQSDIPSSASALIPSFGKQSITSGTATSHNATAAKTAWLIEAPVAGVKKELHIDTSASEVTFGSPTTTITFHSTKHGEGSTMFLTKANLAGTVVQLRGETATLWSVIGSTAGMTIE